MFARSLLAAIVVGALAPAAAAAATHTVVPGETLWGIAMANNLQTRTLATANGLSPEARVIAGTSLTIPGFGAPTTAAPALGSYRVRPGDTLSGIAARQGLSRAALAAANGLAHDGWVLSGTVLELPTVGSAPVAAISSEEAPEALGAYKVRPGDTLTGLAAIARVPVAQMAFMNGLDLKRPLISGTVIKLPTGASVNATGPAPARTLVPQAAPSATPGRLSAAQVTNLAAAQGVPSSLAAAIAWQESGFNNGLVSAANARGIMQIMPGTWSWVQANLAASPLDPASPSDNVRAGSMYLAHLLRQTAGDPAMAAAAYYQGLTSVRRIGMLPETRRYVANVLALRSRFGG
jgi:soluble lytic murein transglycosylase-like protein